MQDIPTELDFIQLTGAQFEASVAHDPDARLWLESPKLKYFHPWIDWFKPVSREVFLAVEKTKKSKPLKIVGMIELQTSPTNEKEAWLMFVSVDPRFQRRGVSRKLFAMLIEHLRTSGQFLVRSRPSETAPEGFQDFVDEVLNAERIPWRQGERRSSID